MQLLIIDILAITLIIRKLNVAEGDIHVHKLSNKPNT